MNMNQALIKVISVLQCPDQFYYFTYLIKKGVKNYFNILSTPTFLFDKLKLLNMYRVVTKSPSDTSFNIINLKLLYFIISYKLL